MSNYEKNIIRDNNILGTDDKKDSTENTNFEEQNSITNLEKTKITEENVVPFHQLFKFSTKPDRFMYVFGILFAITTGLVSPANTYIFGNLANIMISFRFDDTDSFLNAVQLFSIENSIIGIVMLICSYGSITLFNYAAQNQLFKIRGLFFQSVMHQDISWFDLNQSGEVASRMNEDLTKLEEGIGEKVAMFIQHVVAFFGSLILALVKGWQLALVCLISLPVTMISLGLVGMATAKLSQKELKVYAEAGNIAEQAISSVRTVKAFEGENREISFYKNWIEKARKINIQRNFFSGLGFGLLWFIIYASYALAFWYGVGLVLKNYAGDEYYSNYDPGTMITVFFSVMMGSMNIGMASPYIEAFGIAKGAAKTIFNIMAQKPTINPLVERGDNLSEPIQNIEFRSVHFNYPTRPEVPILRNFNLKIQRGETIALVGTSGSGKSTCIQLIQRFYDPSQGTVLFNDKDITEYNVNSLRKRIGVVGQEPVLFATTVYENIRYGREDVTKEEIEVAAKAANAHNFIVKLPNGYNTLVGERGSQLSGGQKQRISIARALVRDPDVLLLDEATSALDTASEKKVQSALDKASEGRTTIIVAHRLSTIRNVSKIIVVNEGQIIETGTHELLMAKKEFYYNLVKAQVGEETKNESVNQIDINDIQNNDDEEIQYFEKKAVQLEEVIEKNNSYIWKIMKYNKPEWFSILVACIASAVSGVAMPIFAILFGDITQILSVPDPVYIRENTNIYSLYFVILGLIVGIATFIQIYALGIAGEHLTERLRGLLFQNILKQDSTWFDDKSNSTGALCGRLSGEAAAVQGATGQRIGVILQSISTFVMAISLSLYYQWKLGLLAIAFSPIILIATFLQGRIMNKKNMGDNKVLENCTKLGVEAVSNVRTVVSLGREDMFHKLYMDLLCPVYKKARKGIHYRGVVYGLARSIMYFSYAACMYYGAILIVNEGITIGVVFKVSQALIMSTITIGNTLAFAPNLQRGINAAENISKQLRRQPAVTESKNALFSQLSANGDVNFNDVDFAYPTRNEIQVLKKLKLNILRGQKVAFVGPSGCGKSTCLQLLLRFYDVDSGSISIDNYDIRNLSFSNLYKQLGIVSQEPILFNRTIEENIAYGDNSRIVSEQEIIAAAKKANIHNFISSLPLGYSTKLGEKGTQLSGGQKQRVAIARVLIRNPKVILLDEATSALDTASEKIVQESLDAASEGRTSISIAHRLSTIINSDIIFVINNGIVEEQGTHSQLLAKEGIYSILYRLQNAIK